jgi:hypothetical protein
MEKPDEFNRCTLDFLGRKVGPHAAGIPYPPNGAKDVRNDPKLSWIAGDKALAHDVYFGTDFDVINEAGRNSDTGGVMASRGQKAISYKPGMLDFNTTYYWRVDEVHGSDIWKGSVWSFSTGNYSVVDNFEDYNNISPDRLFQRWLDGHRGNGTNAVVGHSDRTTDRTYPDSMIMEKNIFQSGRQSMPLYYNNTIAPYISRTDHIFSEPQDWSRGDMEKLTIWVCGIRPLLGGYTYDPDTGLLTVTGAGADIWGQSDQFHYVYQKLSGGGSIQTKVLSLANTVDPNTTNVWAKAAVMIRETLEPESKFASVSVTLTQGCHFQARRVTAAEAVGDSVGENDVDTAEQNAIAAPYWIRIERDSDGNFNGYYSANGSTWTMMTWSPQKISMNRDVYIGLALTSHDVGVQCKAEFTNVTVTRTDDGTMTDKWQSQDIGIKSNDREPIYAVIKDNSAAAATVIHPDPNAVITTDWQVWSIDLAEQVASCGVDLKNIKQLSIGIGEPQAKSPGGKGIVYIDEIRLHQPEKN